MIMRKTGFLVWVLSLACYAASPCSQSGVVFCNGFEGTPTEVNDVWKSATPGQHLAKDPGPFNVSGNQLLKLDLDLANNLQVQTGLSTGYNKLYARWYQKWGAGYDWGKADHLGFTFCSGTGCGGSNYYPDGCSDVNWALLESGGSGSSGSFHWYVYHPGKATQWGNVFNTGTTVTSNKWYCVETMIDLGTPTAGWTGANGVLDTWIDGTHFGPNDCSSWPAQCGGIWFRNCAALQIKRILFIAFQRAGNEQPGVSLYVDDLVVSTQRIGCGARVETAPAALTVTTGLLPTGKAGTAYSTTLIATGGTSPYSWQIASGSLPAGLGLEQPTGKISGTPTASGTFPITFRALDSSNPAQSVTKQLSLTIDPQVGIVLANPGNICAEIRGHVWSGRLVLDFQPGAGKSVAHLYNALGLRVWTYEAAAASGVIQSPVLPNGLYLCQVQNGGKTTAFSFAVVR